MSNLTFNFDDSYTSLPAIFYTRLTPVPVSCPKMVLFNHPLAKALGLDPDSLNGETGALIFSGNLLPEGNKSIAQAYAGHQFGHFTMLGDGRAVLLGEQVTPKGERFDLQLKGSGPTPYSRGGDGRASLGPMLREYIISEAMFALGIPTTRSLAVVVTGDPVFRETRLDGAILTRVAASHIRVGTFQYAALESDRGALLSLANYTIRRHYPHIALSEGSGVTNKRVDNSQAYLSLLREVIARQASLIAKWQLVGFIHGVMNTDNMTISGETIDYGPCAFMDHYDPKTVFSSIDRQGRYAYGSQPTIGGWNLARFSETMIPLLDNNNDHAIDMAQEALQLYAPLYRQHWLKGMGHKLGLITLQDEDEALVNDLLTLMEGLKMDFTNTFAALTTGEIPAKPGFNDWWNRWQQRLAHQPQSMAESRELMEKSNPAVIPRNHLVEAALAEAVNKNDLSPFYRLLEVLSNPYDHERDNAPYTQAPPGSSQPYRTFCGT